MGDTPNSDPTYGYSEPRPRSSGYQPTTGPQFLPISMTGVRWGKIVPKAPLILTKEAEF